MEVLTAPAVSQSDLEKRIAGMIEEKSADILENVKSSQNMCNRRVAEYMTELKNLPATIRRDVELAAKVEAAGFEVRFRSYLTGFAVTTTKDRLLGLSKVLGSFKVEYRGLADYTDLTCNTVEVHLAPRKYPFVSVYYNYELTEEEQKKAGRCKIVEEVRTTRSLVCEM
jgi:hypothetical protein